MMDVVKDKTTNGSFPVSIFPELAALEAENFWFRSRNRLIISILKRYFSHAKNFLEIGCGTGFVLSGIAQEFPHIQLSGSELYSDGLLYAAQRVKQASLFQMDARCIPFQAEFDVIGAFDMLEHIEEDTEVLMQIHQALRSGGGVLVTVPQHPWLWSQADEYACHVRRYTALELKTKLINVGFKIVKMTSFISFLLPLMMMARLKNKKPGGVYDPMAEFKISKVLNNVLEKTLSFERLFINMGINLPVGGSLLAVATKG